MFLDFEAKKSKLVLSKSEKEDVMQLVEMYKRGARKLVYKYNHNGMIVFEGYKSEDITDKRNYCYRVSGNIAHLVYELMANQIVFKKEYEFDLADVIRRFGYSLSKNKFNEE